MRLPDEQLKSVREAARDAVRRQSDELAKDMSNKALFAQAAASQMMCDLIDEVLELRAYVCDLHDGTRKRP